MNEPGTRPEAQGSLDDETALERQLALRVRDGDDAAFDELDRRVRPALRRYAARRLGPSSRSGVDDVVQETLLYVLDRLRQGIYLEQYPFRVFLFGLARNIVMRHLAPRPASLATLAREEDGSPRELEVHAGCFEGFAETFRHVAGVHRYETKELSDVFLDLLATFYSRGGYPHQQLTFAYSLMLWGRAGRRARASKSGEGKVPITGDAQRVVDRCSGRSLSELADDLAIRLSDALDADVETILELQRPLTNRLRLSVGELTRDDPRSRRVYHTLLHRSAGTTRLEEYFGNDARESVANWTRQVKEHVKRAYGTGGSLPVRRSASEGTS